MSGTANHLLHGTTLPTQNFHDSLAVMQLAAHRLRPIAVTLELYSKYFL
jgi:hypothetical protein